MAEVNTMINILLDQRLKNCGYSLMRKYEDNMVRISFGEAYVLSDECMDKCKVLLARISVETGFGFASIHVTCGPEHAEPLHKAVADKAADVGQRALSMVLANLNADQFRGFVTLVAEEAERKGRQKAQAEMRKTLGL
jgi:hypothetical protein